MRRPMFPCQENYTEAIDLWSVGCIYAELLGMLDGTKTDDRGPLFPGSSCFPLSPDHKHKTDYKSPFSSGLVAWIISEVIRSV